MPRAELGDIDEGAIRHHPTIRSGDLLWQTAESDSRDAQHQLLPRQFGRDHRVLGGRFAGADRIGQGGWLPMSIRVAFAISAAVHLAVAVVPVVKTPSAPAAPLRLLARLEAPQAVAATLEPEPATAPEPLAAQEPSPSRPARKPSSSPPVPARKSTHSVAAAAASGESTSLVSGAAATASPERGSSGPEPFKISATDSPQDFSLRWWLESYENKIRARGSINFPGVGELVLRAKFATNGEIVDVQLVRGSGNQDIDRRVLELVRNISPGPLPAAIARAGGVEVTRRLVFTTSAS